MNFVEQLQQLDFKDIGRWPFLFRALGVLVVFVFMTILLVWWFVWSDNGNRPALLRARAEQVSLWGTFDQKQRKAANLEAYRQQLAEIERTFGAMLRQLPGKTEVPSLLVDISQTGLRPACRSACSSRARKPSRTSTRSCRSRSSSPAATTSSACSCPALRRSRAS